MDPDRPPGGTWLGLTTGGRLAALTNFREPQLPEHAALKGRGALTGEFLRGGTSPRQYAEDLAHRGDEYGGFNILVGDLREGSLWYSGNKSHQVVEVEVCRLEPGKWNLIHLAMVTFFMRPQYSRLS